MTAATFNGYPGVRARPARPTETPEKDILAFEFLRDLSESLSSASRELAVFQRLRCRCSIAADLHSAD
jgi:hypothetical protein